MDSPRPVGVFGGNAWSILRLAGIELLIDRSWILIFLLVTYSLASYLGGEGVEAGPALRWSLALLGSLLFFSSLVLHELGHSLVALRCGVRVRSITLFLFGGVAQLESEPERPRDEVGIAVAGPAVSLGLGLALLGLARSLEGEGTVRSLATLTFAWLGTVNLVLAAFNVLPGFPLDGGRVLRGLVWWASGSFGRATRAAAFTGSLVAYGLMGLGALAALFGGMLLGGLWLVAIGWFLLTAGRLSVAQLTLESILTRAASGELMETVTDSCLTGGEMLAEVAESAVLKRGVRTLFVVDGAGRLRGLLTLSDIAGTPAGRRPTTKVEQIMRPLESLETVRPEESAWSAFRKMAARSVNQLPVLVGERLVGSVTRERLVALVQSALALEPA